MSGTGTSDNPCGSLIDSLGKSHLLALWDQVGRSVGSAPQAKEAPFIWHWSDLQRFAAAAAGAVSIADADRRVLVMANPTYGGKPGTAGTLNAALQILEPGEIADPHRHSLAAIRVVTSAAGGYTTVNETRCRMEEGDLILTPAWCWHGHHNDTQTRVMWVDVLDVPLVFHLDGVFFEHPGPATPKLVDAVEFDEAAWSSGGLIAPAPPRSENYSPKFRYDWRSSRRALDGLAPAADGSRLMRYVNPLTGGAVMPTIDCYALKLAARQETIPRRSTSSAICVVIAGEGHTAIGNETIHWAQNDVFTLPHWQWASHVAMNGDAYLAVLNNQELLQRLGLLITETRH